MPLIDFVRDNLIGEEEEVDGPYGKRAVTYADFTASGRSLRFIEEYVQKQVLPLYGNSHTQTSKTGRQTTQFLEEARALIKHHTGCTKKDALVFVGSGCTAAANRLVQMLGLSASWEIKEALQRSHPEMCRAVVFVTAYEHHSNLLPWRESLAEVICIPDEPQSGRLDLAVLEERLIQYKDRPLKIGAFSAASNVTGIITDVDSVSILLHKYGAVAVWDYACSAPYVEIDMNARVDGAHTGAHKDAVFISPHKFIGGPQTPGILIFKKELSGRRDKCSLPGGGAVFYVTPQEQVYLRHCEEREEAGTPALVGSIRCGLAFQLKHRIGCESIKHLDDALCERVLHWMAQQPSIHVLGSASANRLPIISFMVHHEGMYLHYNYVCALLNDLFGIQARGGCMCAGPYSQQLLGIDSQLSARIQRELSKKEDNEVVRPGYVRLSLHYTMRHSTVDFLLQALDFIATDGWRLLPQYTFDARSGLWTHRFNQRPKRTWLNEIDYDALIDEVAGESMSGALNSAAHQVESDRRGSSERRSEQTLLQLFATYVSEAKAQAQVANSQYKYGSTAVVASHVLPHGAEELRWFLLPYEAMQMLQRRQRSDGMQATNAGWRAPFICRDYEAASTGAPSAGWASICVASGHSELVADPANRKQTQRADGECLLAIGADGPRSEVDADVDAFLHQLEEDESSDCGANMEVAAGVRAANKDVAKLGGNDVNKDTAAVGSSKLQRSAFLFPAIPQKLYDSVVDTIREHEMIKDGDRVLLGLSGGKDSLTLLHVLRQMRERGPVAFELAAATVDPMADGFDPSPLIPYLEQLGVTYFYERQDIIGQAKGLNISFSSEVAKPNPHLTREEDGASVVARSKAKEKRSVSSICAFCSRMKRGVLYGCARKHGYSVLVMAQHLDDLAESFLMSVFHNGFLRTMKANYTVNEGDLRVIRPLINTRESECNEFADDAKLPVINENCPACFEAPRERYRTKCLLASQEHLFPNLFASLQRCMRPLMEAEVERFLRDKDTELALLHPRSAASGRKKPQKLTKRAQKLRDHRASAHERESMVRELTSLHAYEEALARAQKNSELLVVKFGASWCGPCGHFDPIFAEFCKQNPSVYFAAVDVDHDEAMADRCAITALPTIKLYRNSVEIDTLVNPTEENLRQALIAARADAA